jgi:hypothetical protein
MTRVTGEQWPFAYRCAPTLLIELSVASLVIRRMLGFHQRNESATPTCNAGFPEFKQTLGLIEFIALRLGT